MSARIDLTGKRVGRWLVLRYASDRLWLCRCDCGTEKTVDGSSLRRGLTQGCIKCHPALGRNRTHGQSKRSKLYGVWSSMKSRCGNVNDPAYVNYGGRGISVCPEWQADFACFQSWALASGYRQGLTIEREDNDGPYSPDNCKWVTLAEQKMNRRNTIRVEWRGATRTLLDVSRETGVPYDLLKQRVCRYRWPIDRAVAEPSRAPAPRKRAVTFDVRRGNIDQIGGEA